MSKQSHIIRDVEQQIATGQLRAGQPLPTQKQLVSRYGVAMDTVQQAMGQLQSRGIVIARRGKGTVVGDSMALQRAGITRPLVEMLQFGTAGQRDPLLSDTSHAIQCQLNARGLDLMIRADAPQTPAALSAWAQRVRAVVVAGKLPPKFLHALRAAGRPIVALGELYHGACPPGIGQVTAALPSVVDLAMACLHMLGHRRILFVRSDWSYYFRLVSKVFRASAAQLGCAETCQELAVPLEDDASSIIAALKHQPKDQWPTALLVDGGHLACRTIFALQSAGIAVPEQLSVFALSGTQREHLPLPNLSRSEIPPQRIGQRLADVLLESLRTGAVIRDCVPPSLHRGDTAQAVHPSSR